jgi:hypothetical protein
MNETLTKFIKSRLQYELVDHHKNLDATAQAIDGARDGALKSGFEHLLESRELSPEQYTELTDVEFSSEDALYGYLRAVYAYLFQGSEEWPATPY